MRPASPFIPSGPASAGSGCWLLVLALTGCNMIKGPRRDHECRSTLRSVMVAEFSFYSTNQRYSIHPHELGFAPSTGNRYLYVFSAQGEVTRRDGKPSPAPLDSVGYGPDTEARKVTVEELLPKFPVELRATLGLSGACPSCEVTVGCIANLDQDPDVDVWTISSGDRDGAARGTPLKHLNDVD